MSEPRYAPDVEHGDNGVIFLDYGRAHAARQADAEALLDEISWAGTAIATTVRCSCKRRIRLATVYRTVPAVIAIFPETHSDPELVSIRRQADGMEITYGTDVFADILHASDDRDLEARCRDCGRHELDREQIVAAFDAGQGEVRVSPH